MFMLVIAATCPELYKKYFPIERSATMSREAKIPLMREWYEGNHERLLRENFTRQSLVLAAAAANTELRAGADTLIHTLHSLNVPLLIFSAGIGGGRLRSTRMSGGTYRLMCHILQT